MPEEVDCWLRVMHGSYPCASWLAWVISLMGYMMVGGLLGFEVPAGGGDESVRGENVAGSGKYKRVLYTLVHNHHHTHQRTLTAASVVVVVVVCAVNAVDAVDSVNAVDAVDVDVVVALAVVVAVLFY